MGGEREVLVYLVLLAFKDGLACKEHGPGTVGGF